MALRILFTVFLALFTISPALAAEKKTVKLVYVEWPCAVVTHSIAKVAIEERLGYTVELIPVSVPVKFQAIASGEADATLAAWLPTTQGTYMEALKGKLLDLGPLVTGTRIGWVVPDYVPYKSIEELRGKAKEFKGKIFGIDPGAVYMETSEKAIGEYGLDGFTLDTSNDAVMVAMLADHIKRNEPVIVTGWAPHWKFGKWNLHFLDDPKKLFGEEEAIHTVVRLGLKEDMPDVYQALDAFAFIDTVQLQQLMAENNEKGADPLENARAFVRNNKEQVDSWFK